MKDPRSKITPADSGSLDSVRSAIQRLRDTVSDEEARRADEVARRARPPVHGSRKWTHGVPGGASEPDGKVAGSPPNDLAPGRLDETT